MTMQNQKQMLSISKLRSFLQSELRHYEDMETYTFREEDMRQGAVGVLENLLNNIDNLGNLI